MCHIPLSRSTHLSFFSVNTYRATWLTEGSWYISGETDHLIGSVHTQIKALSISHGNNEATDICWHVFPLEHNLLLFSMMHTKKGIDWSQDTGMLISTGSCQIVHSVRYLSFPWAVPTAYTYGQRRSCSSHCYPLTTSPAICLFP